MFFNPQFSEEDMIYIFVDMNQKILIPFKGTEDEMQNM